MHLTLYRSTPHRMRFRAVSRVWDAAEEKWADTVVDLTGLSATVLWSLNGGASESRDATLEDQTSSTGYFYYDVLSTDIDAVGGLAVRATYTNTDGVHPSEILHGVVLGESLP